ncbi:MAG TPA: hypothetical protein DCS93_08150 [Microscillaceae bacterium]|nr:hypothetical protein [Microscillaceae bacterium]
MASNIRFSISGLLFAKLFLLLLTIICFYVAFKSKPAKRVAQFFLPIDSLDKEEALETPKFAIKKNVGVYRLELSAHPTITPTHKNFIYLMAELYDNKGVRVNEFDTEFWWETGSDSDGRWTEKDVSENWLMKSRQGNDSLYLEIVGEKLLKANYRRSGYNKRFTESIKVQVWEDPQGPIRRYFRVFAIVFLLSLFISLFIKN